MAVDPEVPQYNIGETVLREAEFRDEGDTLYNPNTIEFSYKNPNDLIVPVAPVAVAIGKWKVEFEVTIAGRWVYEWVTTGGSTRKGGEFDVLGSLLDEPTTGIVARAVASLMPLTWDNLKNSPLYGPAQLGFRIKATKHRVLGSVQASADESGYTPLLVDYVSKCVALDLIPTAIEFWMRQKVSVSTTGTNETLSFTDPINALRELEKRLAVEVVQLSANPDLIALSSNRSEAPGLSDNAAGEFATEEPYDWPRAFNDA